MHKHRLRLRRALTLLVLIGLIVTLGIVVSSCDAAGVGDSPMTPTDALNTSGEGEATAPDGEEQPTAGHLEIRGADISSLPKG